MLSEEERVPILREKKSAGGEEESGERREKVRIIYLVARPWPVKTTRLARLTPLHRESSV